MQRALVFSLLLGLLFALKPAVAQDSRCATGTTSQLTDNTIHDRLPKMGRRYAAWIGGDGMDAEVYLYDLASGTTTQLTHNALAEKALQIDAGQVAWISDDGTNRQVWLASCAGSAP